MAWLFLSTTVASLSAQASIFEHLTTTEAAAMTLSTDVSALMAEKNSTNYLPGVLTTADGKSYSTQVRPRGKYRRKIAPIPPLKLKFKKKALEAEGLDTLNEIKLVLPSVLDERGDELVVREYLAYRMYEHLSPASVRARLIDLTLLNTGLGNQQQYKIKAILLEDEEETTARLKGTLVDFYGMTMDSFSQQQAALVATFQCMIGNTDWSVEEQRNVRFIRNAAGELLLIPFDFDFSGLVNAPYATPASETGLKNVRERYLMARTLSDQSLTAAAQTLRNARPEFVRLCQSATLPRPATSKIIDYLDSFFQAAEQRGVGSFR
ncbi:MAG: hypothetical protein IT260_17530 [Saprospiraceae bacterium]|nr:hypothetical protein [Saprospiraceae bacterium]